MAASPIAIIQESNRQQATDDGNFLLRSLFFFELRVSPKLLGPSTSQFIFPLIIAPNSYSLEAPFTVEKTPTQGGGLYVEENGIVMRTIRLAGNFGWKPKPYPRNATGTQALALPVEKRSFSRQLSPFVLAEISGARHFQYLEDAVFNMYADLKKDPDTSEETQLFFHNPHDQQVWLVVPEMVKLNRTAEKRVLYDYEIELTVVDRGDAVDFSISEDKALLDTIKDGLRMAKSYVDMATGFQRDVQESINELDLLVRNASKVASDIADLTALTEAFVEGDNSVIAAPAARVLAISTEIDRITVALVDSVDSARGISSNYVNAWRRAKDGLNRLGAHKELFETPAQRLLRAIRERQEGGDAAARVADEDIQAPQTLNQFGQTGTAPLPGAENRAAAELGVGRATNRYSSAKAVTISEGDTLANLAATHLGDARLWQDIAIFNGMKPPYIDAIGGADLGSPENPIPGVFSLGSQLLIPTFSRPPSQLPLLPVLGTSREEPFESQILGTDFLLEATERRDQFDWVVDVEHGSVDFKAVTGRDNLAQALTTRLTTERGFNPLYRQLGYARIIGLNQVNVDFETARFRIVDAITADPRISAVRRLSFESNEDTAPDAVVVDADLEVYGFAQGTQVQAIGV